MKKTKEDLLQNLSVDPSNREELNEILVSFSAKADFLEKRNDMLIQLLKKVRSLMNSPDYSDDFDSLYDEIDLALSKLDIK